MGLNGVESKSELGKGEIQIIKYGDKEYATDEAGLKDFSKALQIDLAALGLLPASHSTQQPSG
ncbi:MAG: hypothetical protein KDK40_04920 [Chlamydiia bacterium]|nr:hypothetical protein [Chlamydiia bacterium]